MPILTGSALDVRRLGSERWVRCRVDLASANEKSLALSADEGLPLGAIDRRTGRQVLLLTLMREGYEDVATGFVFEIRPVPMEGA